MGSNKLASPFPNRTLSRLPGRDREDEGRGRASSASHRLGTFKRQLSPQEEVPSAQNHLTAYCVERWASSTLLRSPLCHCQGTGPQAHLLHLCPQPVQLGAQAPSKRLRPHGGDENDLADGLLSSGTEKNISLHLSPEGGGLG